MQQRDLSCVGWILGKKEKHLFLTAFNISLSIISNGVLYAISYAIFFSGSYAISYAVSYTVSWAISYVISYAISSTSSSATSSATLSPASSTASSATGSAAQSIRPSTRWKCSGCSSLHLLQVDHARRLAGRNLAKRTWYYNIFHSCHIYAKIVGVSWNIFSVPTSPHEMIIFLSAHFSPICCV